ncbi:GNAT family N-acetyltransferase [Providencia heimbachae]|uniref:GCN5 family N-acetyltransferase n=1 Tax=Providencia heimbachae ATCC 35613 TaxID=1354272 RepID=A0A1B7K0F6_9GAMM|nr:GNAT family protein [Providencia heimbachae]OAT53619.1 GCN5 family N-acetyltransferase [Providencia heimbachae ATCC 35613]QCJ70764.1 N-acetyltransferase [Providencia heimbachae]SQH13921.1 Putative ribosomal N-acetyltransferase YdaF [Providencia heimbachae]
MQYKNEFGQPVGQLLENWLPRPSPERICLDGDYCQVEPLSLAHAESLYSSFSQLTDTRNWTWLPNEAPRDLSEYKVWIETQCQKNDPLFYTIKDKKTNQYIGVFALMRIDAINGVAEVGHVHFSPLLSGKTMATEAHWLLMKYLFDILGYRRYEWKCNSLNEPSRRAALRLGFQFEGRFRNALVVKGRNRDTDWFSIIDSEWPAINQSIKSWLSPTNYTKDGKQLKSLIEFR